MALNFRKREFLNVKIIVKIEPRTGAKLYEKEGPRLLQRRQVFFQDLPVDNLLVLGRQQKRCFIQQDDAQRIFPASKAQGDA